jgi:hypothetical protein
MIGCPFLYFIHILSEWGFHNRYFAKTPKDLPQRDAEFSEFIHFSAV